MKKLFALIAALSLLATVHAAFGGSGADKIPCSIDRECPVELFCDNRVCVDLNVSCSYDNKCPAECARARVRDLDCPTPTPTPRPTATPKVTPSPTPAPVITNRCDYPAASDRIRCRLGLQEGHAYEYMPEDCVAQPSAEARAACRSTFGRTAECLKNASYSSPLGCAKSVLGITTSVSRARVLCEGNSECLEGLAGRTFGLVKFRFDVLEDRGRSLTAAGASYDALIDFVTRAEELKAEFDSARTVQEKKEIVLRLRSYWNSFKQRAAADIIAAGESGR